ncbi:MAG: hypothetical protein JXB42_08990 [Deltaproteobacteria bacterium]|nr:hypothetical protein [Deltaproteobacteria bacterium]
MKKIMETRYYRLLRLEEEQSGKNIDLDKKRTGLPEKPIFVSENVK